MNKRHKLNIALVSAWLDGRKQSYLVEKVGVSPWVASRMMSQGQLPELWALLQLAKLMGRRVEELVLPRIDQSPQPQSA